MTLQSLILLALKASIPLSVFAIGLGSRFDDALYLLRRPALLVPSVLAMNVVMPLVAATMAWAFDLPGAVEISLVALAVSPIPPPPAEEADQSARRTPSKAPSPPCGTGRFGRRDASRTGPRSPWCSSWSECLWASP